MVPNTDRMGNSTCFADFVAAGGNISSDILAMTAKITTKVMSGKRSFRQEDSAECGRNQVFPMRLFQPGRGSFRTVDR